MVTVQKKEMMMVVKVISFIGVKILLFLILQIMIVQLFLK